MPYKVSFTSRFERDSKTFKKNKLAKTLIKEQIERIIENPNIGEMMSGNIFPFMKSAFGESPQYRILYVKYDCCLIVKDNKQGSDCKFDDLEPLEEVAECEGMIEFAFVRTREDCNNLYKQSKKYFENYLRDID